MKYEWKVTVGTVTSTSIDWLPPALEDVLNALEKDGWEIYALYHEPETTGSNGAPLYSIAKVRIVARRQVLDTRTFSSGMGDGR